MDTSNNNPKSKLNSLVSALLVGFEEHFDETAATELGRGLATAIRHLPAVIQQYVGEPEAKKPNVNIEALAISYALESKGKLSIPQIADLIDVSHTTLYRKKDFRVIHEMVVAERKQQAVEIQSGIINSDGTVDGVV